MIGSNLKKVSYYQTLMSVILGSALIAGCAEIGGQSVSLLPNSSLTDPLEVPPGLSPLPEPEQFTVPGELGSDDSGPPELGPEQLRAYKLWVEFEEFKKYQDEISGVGLSEAEFQTAKLSGEGIFKVSTLEDAEADTIRLQVHSSADSVWNMLPSVLADMSVFVLEVDEETQTIFVSNTGVTQLRKFLDRFRLRENSDSIDKVLVRSLGADKSEVLGFSDLDVPVNPKAGREFFNRLRFYLLARFEVDGEGNVAIDQSMPAKQLVEGDGGQQSIIVAESFGATWVKVGRILQGAGAGIEDINRNEGIYYVSFAESSKQKKKKKFRWQFWRAEDVEVPDQFQYQVVIKERGEQSEISVIATDERPEDVEGGQTEQSILLIIYERLHV